MIQRFLLDRIDAEAAGAAVGVELDLAAFDAAHEAQAALTFVHLAGARTDVALDATVVERVPVRVGCVAAMSLSSIALARLYSPSARQYNAPHAIVSAAKHKLDPPAVAGLFYPDEPSTSCAMSCRNILRTGADIACRAAEGADRAARRLYLFGRHRCGRVRARRVAAADHPPHRAHRPEPSRVSARHGACPPPRSFATPLGAVAIDRELKARCSQREDVVESDAPHALEHCLEVQLPFLQMLFDDFTLLPLVLGSASASMSRRCSRMCGATTETLVLVELRPESLSRL